MPIVSDDAVCIRHWDWSETSQTVSVFTRSLGLIRALAKGSKRPKSPYSGGVELLNRAEAGVLVRPNSELALLTAWDLRQTYPSLRRLLACYNAGLYMADLIHHFVRDHDPHPLLFDALVGSLEVLRSEADVPGALLYFQWCTLVETGYRPELELDAATGAPLPPDAPMLAFSPGLGGFVTETAGSERPDGRLWRVRGQTVDRLRRLAASPSPAQRDGGDGTLDRANRLLASYLRHLLGVQPPTMPLLFGTRLAR